jgi:2-amino-4-hydroxy-6-hydroxymethyldihydropteridine diphosphokinase
MPLRAVVGIGANLGDRLATMRRAVRRIEDEVGRVEARSRAYETAPVGGPVQPSFLNAAVLVTFDGTPLELLDRLLGIEVSLGRVRAERWGPRVIDLDLLWIDGVAVDVPRLTVPHPRLRERAFAVRPLLDVAPEARDPVSGAAYRVPAGDLHDAGEGL